ncbi:MAG: phage holin family protein, partial [Chloroflexi bacterium]|nr:phage holin family protein [Chloroflexota bacterium]
PWWLSALLVGLIVAAVGGFLVWRGMNDLKQGSMAPQATVESLKEDAQWAKDRAK